MPERVPNLSVPSVRPIEEMLVERCWEWRQDAGITSRVAILAHALGMLHQDAQLGDVVERRYQLGVRYV